MDADLVSSGPSEGRIINYLEMLEHSYGVVRESLGPMSRLVFLSEHIFDFTTYDHEMGELFASKAVEVCEVINEGRNFDYIKDPENYRWYLLMVNMPFFADRLEWGTSIRGAWWDHADQTLDSCGIWRGTEQAITMILGRDDWIAFIAAIIEFSSAAGEGGGKPWSP